MYLCVLYLTAGCQESTLKKENTEKPNSYKTTTEEVFYDDDNFKDTRKIFRFEGNEYETSKKTIKIGNLFYTAVILPNKYYIQKNLNITQKDSLNHYMKEFESEIIIQFDFQHYEKKDLLLPEYTDVSYKRSIEYLSSLIQEDFYAVINLADTIRPSGILFERNFNLAPRKRILLYFKTEEKRDKLKLIYNDRIFKKGIIKFNL